MAIWYKKNEKKLILYSEKYKKKVHFWQIGNGLFFVVVLS